MFYCFYISDVFEKVECDYKEVLVVLCDIVKGIVKFLVEFNVLVFVFESNVEFIGGECVFIEDLFKGFV